MLVKSGYLEPLRIAAGGRKKQLLTACFAWYTSPKSQKTIFRYIRKPTRLPDCPVALLPSVFRRQCLCSGYKPEGKPLC
mgnify:CR=1 FL=1